MKPKLNYSPGPKDNCQTPGYAIEPLLPYMLFARYGIIWECACGSRLLSNQIHKYFCIDATDLKDGFDFLQWQPHKWDAIVTNPPFSIKDQFTQRCYDLEKPWALLMPSETVSTKWFIEMANKYSPKPGIIWISPRINFKMPIKGWQGNGAQFPTAWFTWKMGFEGNFFYRADHWTKEYRQRFEV